MKRVFKSSLVVAAILFADSTALLAQQDIQFSQYMFNPLMLNTAYAGYRGYSYANFMYRKQWVKLDGAPETFTASFEWLAPGKEERVALSVRLLSDKLGPQLTKSAFLGYTYRIPLDDLNTRRLCFGMSGGVTQYTVDGAAFRYVDGGDDLIPVGISNKVTPDFNAGVFYYSPKFYVGAGVNNMLTVHAINAKYSWQGTSFQTMEKKIHTYVGAGFVFPISESLKIRPSFLWKEDYSSPSNFDFNAFLLIHDFVWLGGSYRTGMKLWEKASYLPGLEHRDAYSIIIELFPLERLRIGYAYDIVNSKLGNYENGTHELSIGIGFPNRDTREISPRYF